MSAIETFTLPTIPGMSVNPAGLAVSNAGVIYYAISVYGGDGFHAYFKLDTNTGVFTDFNVTGPGLGRSDLFLRTALSADETVGHTDQLNPAE